MAQDWHSARERLQEPASSSHYNASLGYITRYDTVPCVYTTFRSKKLHEGFKVVYVLNDYYTDNRQTFEVFLDDRSQRIKHVHRYYLK